MRKKSIKILILISTIFLFTGCTGLLNAIGISTEPKFIAVDHYYIYGLIENGKINRYGALKNDIHKINFKLWYEDGITVTLSSITCGNSNRIKFYNDFKVITEGREYTIPRTTIEKLDNSYFYELPINSFEWESDIILDIGEIEIYDKDGKVIKERKKIPPVLFRRATIAKITYYDRDVMGRDYDVLYQGWKENYDPSKLKRLFNSHDDDHKIYSE